MIYTAKTRMMRWLLPVALLITAATYWRGLSGGWLFDDYPNIVDNKGVQPHDASLASLIDAALSSPSSEFKRPLSSLSFAFNYLLTGLDPYWMKLTNLVIHLLNGVLVFLLARILLQLAEDRAALTPSGAARATGSRAFPALASPRVGVTATFIAAAWMLLPINLTAVLYVVQRMESMANVFVLVGLIGYTTCRRCMLAPARSGDSSTVIKTQPGLAGCVASIIACTAIGTMAKETAVMLPLYAFLIEWTLFGFASPSGKRDKRILALFAVILALPLIAGLAWLAPQVTNPSYWSTRDFTLRTRLLSEARIVTDYITWTLLPTPRELSFYHDQFRISSGLLSPWTTLASIIVLAGLITLVFWLRRRQPLVALGLALFLGCQSLTGTILPLELVYEHRNYFASFGLMLALVPLLCVDTKHALSLARQVLLGALLLLWAGETALTASAWGNPLWLAETLAARAPDSPRAQYELGRTYIIYSHYDPASPFTKLAYAPLERAAALPESSILPQQALIFMNSRMHLPVKDVWWDSMIAKLKSRVPSVQDESSLTALAKCTQSGACSLPTDRMVQAFQAALSHPSPSARLQATYGDYAWNMLGDQALALKMIKQAVGAASTEPAYRITLARMLAAQGHYAEVEKQIKVLQTLNIGGMLDRDIASLQGLVPANTLH